MLSRCFVPFLERVCLTWEDSVRESIISETLQLIQQIAPGLSIDDPAVVVQVTDKHVVHVALGLASVPTGLQQGPTPQVSYDRFRAWLVAQAHLSPGVSAAQQVDAPQTTCWHHISSSQMHDIVYGRWMHAHW